MRRFASRLNLYLAAVDLAGAAALYVAVCSVHLSALSGRSAVITAILGGAVVVAEVVPITLRRGDKAESYSLSGTAVVALVVTGPLWVCTLAQVSASLLDDVRARRAPAKVVFNVSLYAIGIVAARAVYVSLTGLALTGYTPGFHPDGIIPALLAGVTHFIVNVTLLAVVNAIVEDRPLFSQVPSYFRSEVATALTLLAVGPVVLIALNFSLLTLPIAVLPVLAVSRALAAANRELLAMHDSLTGLPNRALFLERVERLLRDRTSGLTALLFIDLDHFKEVNDAMGHPVGDELLRQVGNRLGGLVGGEDFAARLGGDEFAVVYEGLPSAAAATARAHAVASALARPLELQGVSLHVEASIGIALSPLHAQDVGALLRCADVALYEAKAKGAGSVVHYHPSYDDTSIERLTLMEQLRRGLERELVLHYQPQCRLKDGTIAGVEALVRWQHPTLGLLAPDRFLGAAENTGLMLPLTQHVLQQALAQLRRWRDEGLVLTVSVNLSARNLTSELLEHVSAQLGAHGIAGSALILEVTESAVIHDMASARAVIGQLRALGVRISIDDFGTGHSSLASIRELSPSEVKIDQSFVRAAAGSPRDAALVRAAVELGRSLEMTVVAEGVETAEVLRAVADAGCDLVQGHLVLPPVSGTEIAAWSRRPQAWTRLLRPLPVRRTELQGAVP